MPKKRNKRPKPPPNKEPKKQGRPSVFSQDVFRKIVDLYGQGLTDIQVAEIIGIHVDTLLDWRKKKLAFSWSVAEAKLLADEMVESSLFQRAIGYNHPEERLFCSEGQVIRAETVKHYPPEPKAQIFWLKNRKPKEWKDRVEIAHEPMGKLFIETSSGKESVDV